MVLDMKKKFRRSNFRKGLKMENGIAQFKTEADFQKFKADNPGVKVERMVLAAHPACPHCFGTGSAKSFIGGVVKHAPCKCVKPRREKFRREHNTFNPKTNA